MTQIQVIIFPFLFLSSLVFISLSFIFILRIVKSKNDISGQKIIYSRDRDNIVLNYYNCDNGFYISGKPDLILENDDGTLIIEERRNLKTFELAPFSNLIASYFLCAESEFGKSVEYANITDLRSGKSLKIQNNSEILKSLFRTIDELKFTKSGKLKPVRNHKESQRCYYCKNQKSCKEVLTGIE